jgi:hypothetical protein
VKDENGDVLADSHNILNMTKNYFSLSLNVKRASDVRQKEVHTAEPRVPQSSLFEDQITIVRFKKYKSPEIDHTQTEVIKQIVQY